MACNTNANRCRLGVTSCATGTVTCVDGVGNTAAGTSCGAGQVCNGTGACVTCTAGTACTGNPNPCRAGVTSCASGSPVCTDGASQLPNGTNCGSGQVCNNGNCGSCTAGGPCTTNPNSCRVGVISCTTGTATCVDSASNTAAGTACGTNQVCSGGGTCVACTANQPCTGNPSVCRRGLTSCTTGAQTCANSTALDAGTPCGANQVCNAAGTCIGCTAGAPCTTNPSPCRVGAISCSTGAGVCSDTAANAAAGTSCGSNGEVCDGSGGCGFPPNLPAIAVAAGRTHSCAVASNNTVWCWGGNDYGQLGNGTMGNAGSVRPAQVPGISTAVAVSAYYDHTCVRTSAGALRCWGYNAHSELGNNSTSNAPSPITPTGMGSNVRDVATGKVHTCAIRTDGGVLCWGQNNGGNLGNGDNFTDQPVAGLVTGISNAVAISAGENATCAVVGTGGVRCWGSNGGGQIGSTTSMTASPVVVPGVAGAREVSIGYDHACASGDAGVWCWGDNSNGQLGTGATGSGNNAPVLISGTAGAAGISVGFDSTCALTGAGAVRCWGWNPGSLPVVNTTAPATKAGLTNLSTAVSVGQGHACAIRDGGVRCWGANDFGQLGDGTTSYSSGIVTVPGFR